MLKLIKKILYPKYSSSKSFIKHLRKVGISVGENCYVYEPKSVNIDIARPYLLNIGNNVVICSKTTILTHDYSHTVLYEKYGVNIGDAKPVKIGNNVFIGIGAFILMGSTIGNNVIVGANSVVHGCIPDNCVVAGNPAKIICKIDEFYKNRIKNELECAKNNVLLCEKKFNRIPSIYEMGDAFAWLYLPRTNESINKYKTFFHLPGKDSETLIKNFMKSKPKFKSYKDFIEFIKKY